MDNLYFNNYEDFACEIANKYESIKDNEYNDVAVVAKYEEARQIIKELLCIGYDLHSIEMHDDEWDGYDSEYIVSLYDNEIWCEPMLRESGYITDDSPFMYVLDNCSSKVIPYCKGEAVYEVFIDDVESDNDESYTINGKSASKEEFGEYVSQFRKNNAESDDLDDNNSEYHITIKGNLDMGDAEKIIENMERRMAHMQDMFDEMNQFRRLFIW